MFLTDWKGKVLIYNEYDNSYSLYDSWEEIPDNWNFGCSLEDVEISKKDIITVACVMGNRGIPDWLNEEE